MSGTRYTEDLHSIKTRQFTLQNPDGSFPSLGVVLAVGDNIGTIVPVNDISVNSLTVDQLNITGYVNQTTMYTSAITTRDISAANVRVSGLTVTNDISVNKVNLLTLQSQDTTANTFYTPSVSALGDSAIDKLIVGLVTNSAQLNAGTLTATDISTVAVTVTGVRATNASSLTYNANVFNAYDLSGISAKISDLSAQVGYISGQVIASSLTTNTLKTTTTTVPGTLTTDRINVAGIFSFENIVFTNDASASIIVAADISTNSLLASRAVFSTVNAQTFDVSGLNYSSAYSFGNLTSSNMIDVSSANVAASVIGSLTVSDTATMPIIQNVQSVSSAGTVTTNTMTSSIDTQTTTAVTPVLNIAGYNIAYTPSTGLTVNGATASDISRLVATLFNPPIPINNLRTVADISATLYNTVNIYNSLLQIFSRLGVVVNVLPTPGPDTTPRFTFNSPASMQFIINGTTLPPVMFSIGSYTVNQLLTALNAVCGPNITFVWRQSSGTIAIDATGNAFIADVSSTPTGSLQLLRSFGFTINDTNNLFENYILNSSTGKYSMTPQNLYNSWRDKSAMGYVATAVDNAITSVPYPYNNLRALNLGPNRMRIPSFTWNTSFTTAMVFNASVGKLLLSQVMSGNSYLNYVFSGNWSLTYVSKNPNFLIAKDLQYTQANGNPAPCVPSNQWVMLILGYNKSTSLSHYSVNGIVRTATYEKSNDPVTGSTTEQYYINGNGNAPFDTTQIAEIVHYNTSITNQQRMQLEAYLGTKWNIPIGISTPISSIVGCQLWLDAKDASTIVGTTWNDKSGRGNNVSSTAAISTSVGKGVMINGNLNNVLTNSTISIPISYTLFVVGQLSDLTNYSGYSPGYDRLINFGSNQNGFLGTSMPGVPGSANSANFATFTGNGAAWNNTGPNNTNSPLTASTLYAMTMVVDAANNVSPFLNGYSQTQRINTLSLPTTAVRGITIGGVPNQYWYGSVAEVILFNGVLTDIQRQQVETYLIDKWDILPAITNPATAFTDASCTLWLDGNDISTLTATLTPTSTPSLNVPNTLSVIPDITYTSVDAYTMSFQLNNGSASAPGTKYLSLYSDVTGYLLFDLSSSVKTVTNLPPNTGTLFTATFLDSYNRSNPLTMMWITARIPAPINLSATVGCNTFTVSWQISPSYQGRNYSYGLDASTQNTITPSYITVSNNTYSYTYANLTPNTSFLINVNSIDVSYNNSASLPTPITVTTNSLVVAPPVISYSKNNVLAVSQNPASIVIGNNLKGTLTYSINGTQYPAADISGTPTFNYIVPTTVAGTGSVNCFLQYTDGAFNTATSGNTTFLYDASFGFYNLTDVSSAVVTSSQFCGYSFVNYRFGTGPAAGPFIGNVFNRIIFPRGLVASPPSVTFVAEIYAPNLSYNMWLPPFTITTNLGTKINNSEAVTLGSGPVTLIFNSPVYINSQTTVLFQVEGSGSIQIPTFDQRVNNPPQETVATALTYAGSTMTNAFASSGHGAICQFKLV